MNSLKYKDNSPVLDSISRGVKQSLGSFNPILVLSVPLDNGKTTEYLHSLNPRTIKADNSTCY